MVVYQLALVEYSEHKNVQKLKILVLFSLPNFRCIYLHVTKRLDMDVPELTRSLGGRGGVCQVYSGSSNSALSQRRTLYSSPACVIFLRVCARVLVCICFSHRIGRAVKSGRRGKICGPSIVTSRVFCVRLLPAYRCHVNSVGTLLLAFKHQHAPILDLWRYICGCVLIGAGVLYVVLVSVTL